MAKRELREHHALVLRAEAMKRRALLLLVLAACPSPPLDPISPKLVIRLDAAERTDVDFGEVVVSNRVSRTLVFENIGRRSLEIETAEYQGDTTFSHTPLPTTLAIGEQAKVVFSFEPDRAGPGRGAITLRTNELVRKDVLIALTGNGTDPSIRVCAPPLDLIDQNCRPGNRRLDFGRTLVGGLRTRQVSTAAIGGSAVEVTNIAWRYIERPSCKSPGGFEIPLAGTVLHLAPKDVQKLDVLFQPQCAGDYAAELTFETSDPKNPGPRVLIEGQGEPDCVARSERYTPVIEYDNKVDILFILDDSSSMQYIQDTVKQYAASFITELSNPAKPMDFHIGVTTTDLAKPSRRGKLVSRTVAAGAFTETIRVINKHSLQNAPNPADRGPVRAFQLLMEAIDTSGSADEFGFATAGAALTYGGSFSYTFGGVTQTIQGAADISTSTDPAKPNGFLRPDARLSVIILSDEDDSTENVAQMAAYVRDLGGLVGRPGVPAGFKQRVLDDPAHDFQVFAVVDPSATTTQGCPAPPGWQPGDPPYSYGSGTPSYHAGVAAFGTAARIVSLCSDFPTTLSDLAKSIARPQCSFEVQAGVVTIGEAASLCITGGRCFAPGEYTIEPPSNAHRNGLVRLTDAACPSVQTELQFDFTSCQRSLDADNDGIPDLMDVCPAIANVSQSDEDSDGTGDACE